MSDYLYNEYGYLIETGDDTFDAVTSNTLESYLRKYVKVYAGHGSAEFVKYETDSSYSISLYYTIAKEDCYECEQADDVEGICAGHEEPHKEYIYYKRGDIYAWTNN
jgi:hypothetical protein